MKLPWHDETVTFARFMEFCLYDPEQGYYTSGGSPFGPDGDYYTSPYTHPLFAHTLGDVLEHAYRVLGEPRRFDVVELGAGEGLLAEQVRSYLEQAHPGLFRALRYVPLEIGQGALPREIEGVVFSNEFFDALPVHRVRVKDSMLREICVRIQDTLAEVEAEISDPRILDYMKLGFPLWREGHEYEVNLRMVEMLQALDRCLAAGMVITVDYGYDAADYERLARPRGTLMCYRRHQALADPYQDPGRQDMTAHVNFRVLRKTGEALGWRNEPIRTQREFLMDWGLEKRLQEEEQHGLLRADRLEERLQLRSLLAPGGISDTMKVLLQKVRLT